MMPDDGGDEGVGSEWAGDTPTHKSIASRGVLLLALGEVIGVATTVALALVSGALWRGALLATVTILAVTTLALWDGGRDA
jgi:hypothetical protein